MVGCPVSPKVFLPRCVIALILKFLSISSRAAMKLLLSLFRIDTGKITEAIPKGFNTWAILSTNNVSISEPLLDILSSIENLLSLSFRCGLKAFTE